jgi:hypothetical protein
MSNRYRPKFDKRAAQEAGAFLITSILGIIFSAAYSSSPFGNTEVVLLVLVIVLTGGLYYFRSPKTMRVTSKTIIQDLLLAAGVSLGPLYRLNIMRPIDHQDDAERYFIFLCHFRMQNIHRYERRIRLSTPGVGQAYTEKRLVHVGPSEVASQLDDYPSHVWSINVEGSDQSRCVLNIDTSESIDASHISHVSKVIEDLAKAIQKYNPGQLTFE